MIFGLRKSCLNKDKGRCCDGFFGVICFCFSVRAFIFGVFRCVRFGCLVILFVILDWEFFKGLVLGFEGLRL